MLHVPHRRKEEGMQRSGQMQNATYIFRYCIDNARLQKSQICPGSRNKHSTMVVVAITPSIR